MVLDAMPRGARRWATRGTSRFIETKRRSRRTTSELATTECGRGPFAEAAAGGENAIAAAASVNAAHKPRGRPRAVYLGEPHDARLLPGSAQRRS